MKLKFSHLTLNCHPERSRRTWSALASQNIVKAGTLLVLICLFAVACNDDEKPDTAPKVTTGIATVTGATTATVSGEITDDGGPEVVASGFVYSTTNGMPTLEDSFTEETATDGEYSSDLTDLTPSTEYHVRAYAINEKGVGYGDVVDFTSGNAAPVATNVVITGTNEANTEVSASYTYSDSENNTESGTTFQWYVANDGTGTGEIAIVGATAQDYIIAPAYEDKFIRVGVTPNAASGTTTGEEVKSPWVEVGEATTVTFPYNNQSYTYGILISEVTGRKWMDRNLGAPSGPEGAPTAYNDWEKYGDFFQWGRAADGHQLIIRGSTSGGTTAVNETTTNLSVSDTPADAKFITNSNVPFDWRNSQNDNLWQAPAQINNPCPNGWHIPTAAEWLAEDILNNTVEELFDKFNITCGGQRFSDSGSISGVNLRGLYWTSDTDGGNAKDFWFWSGSTPTWPSSDGRAAGHLCRCIKDQ